MGVRLDADLDLGLGGKPTFIGSPLASLWRTARQHWIQEHWTTEQLLHLALAAVAILGWSLVYVTLTRGVDPPQVAKDNIRTEISINLAPPR
jgi:hypothetical protein